MKTTAIELVGAGSSGTAVAIHLIQAGHLEGRLSAKQAVTNLMRRPPKGE